MDWLFDHFQYVILFIFVGVSLLKQFLESKKEAADVEDEPIETWTPPPTLPPQRRPLVPPPLSRPPPVIQEAPVPHRQAPLPPPPLSASMTEAAAVMERQHDIMDRLHHAQDAKKLLIKNAGLSSHTVTKTQKKRTALVSPSPGLRGILRDRQSIRRAMVLKEVLGPPLGLR
jgi:hypothetical protein